MQKTSLRIQPVWMFCTFPPKTFDGGRTEKSPLFIKVLNFSFACSFVSRVWKNFAQNRAIIDFRCFAFLSVCGLSVTAGVLAAFLCLALFQQFSVCLVWGRGFAPSVIDQFRTNGPVFLNKFHVDAIDFVYSNFWRLFADQVDATRWSFKWVTGRFRSRVCLPCCDWSIRCGAVVRAMNCVMLPIVQLKTKFRIFDWWRTLPSASVSSRRSVFYLLRTRRSSLSDGGLNKASTECFYQRCILRSLRNGSINLAIALIMHYTVYGLCCVLAMVVVLDDPLTK